MTNRVGTNPCFSQVQQTGNASADAVSMKVRRSGKWDVLFRAIGLECCGRTFSMGASSPSPSARYGFSGLCVCLGNLRNRPWGHCGSRYWWQKGARGSLQFNTIRTRLIIKAHTVRSTPSVTHFPSDPFETVPVSVWMTVALSRPFYEDLSALPLSTPRSLLPVIDGVISLAVCP